MSVTVAEFIEWLKTKDQSAIVQVVMHTDGSGYYEQGGVASIEDFDTTLQFGEHSPEYGKTWEYTDFRENPYVSENPNSEYYNKSYLLLGELNG